MLYGREAHTTPFYPTVSKITTLLFLSFDGLHFVFACLYVVDMYLPQSIHKLFILTKGEEVCDEDNSER